MDTMTTRERCRAVLNFQPFDRLPLLEWAPFWNLTLDRWHAEGLPQDVDLNKHFGLEWYPRDWLGAGSHLCPKPEDGRPLISSMDDYERLLEYLYPWPRVNEEISRKIGAMHERGEIALWFVVEGFFWHPRTLFGIEPHLYAFYDQPELMHRMNSDMADYQLRYIDEICKYSIPQFMTFAEDMSYNHGPMISKELFDEFMMPYYRRVVPTLNEYGIIPMVDSDGDVTELAHWLEEAGVEGILPLERQAGVDMARLRAEHPTMCFIGHYDKMVMSRGEEAMRAEFERLLPIAARGGFIISVDHQTPPEVSYENYQIYMRLFREYAAKAGEMSQTLLA